MPIDGALIQSKIWKGMAIAARVTGFPHRLYRPGDTGAALDLLNWIGTVPVTIDSRPNYGMAIPALHKDAMRYALVDAARVQRGDYLVGPQETVFIAALPALQPIPCVSCNATLSLRRGVAAPSFGAVADPSNAPTSEAEVLTAWPASLRYASRGGGDDVQLPGDSPPPQYEVLWPEVPSLDPPRAGDVLTDEFGRRYAVQWCEVSALGWRLHARLLVAA